MRLAAGILTLWLAGCAAQADVSNQPARTAPDEPTPPNILLILADDLGTDKVGAYAEHAEAPPTPNIDALASRGVLFRNAWSAPVCSPTRALLMTGRYGRRTGIGQIVHAWKPEPQLALQEVTIAELLRDYTPHDWDTSLVGKWHLSTATGDPRLDPGHQGFAWFAGSMGNLRDPFTEERSESRRGYHNWIKNTNGQLESTGVYATTDTTNDAIARMGDMRAPWFLFVSLNAPHFPIELPPSELAPTLSSREAVDSVDVYDTIVEAMDTEIGRLVDAVPANTTVILLADNGTPKHGVQPVDGERPAAKGSLYEAGINVPMIVAGASVSGPPRQSPALVQAADVFATIAEIAGIPAHAMPARIDGTSFGPVLADPSVRSVNQTIYAEKFGPNGHGPKRYSVRTVRDHRYKLVINDSHNPDARYHQLYDLRDRFDDGPDLLTSPEPLSQEARRSHRRLKAQMKQLIADLDGASELPVPHRCDEKRQGCATVVNSP